MIFRIAVLVFLIYLSVCDLKSRTVPVKPMGLFAALICALHVFLRDMTLPGMLAGMIPGAGMLLLALLFHASIGTGDGMTCAVCGSAIGFDAEFSALTAALLLCAAYSVLQLVRRKVTRSSSLPFLPFLAAGHVLVLAAQGLSTI